MKTVFIKNKSKIEGADCLLNFNSLFDFYKNQIIVKDY